MANYQDEFNNEYEQPRINRMTVGFSGIDPSQKTLFEAADYDYSKLTAEQQAAIGRMIEAYVSKLSIRIDSGNVDPSAQEPELPTVTLRPSEIPHEGLAGLLGGDLSGHYHLTDEQLERLTAYPAYDRLVDDITEDISHNSLKRLQGGKDNEYYHLTRSDVEALAKLVVALMPNGRTVELPETVDNHEELIGLLGGDLSGHYHLTKQERDKFSEYPEYNNLAGNIAGDVAGDIEHNSLKGLQGGKSGERYHLSEEDVDKLAKLTAALIPDGQTVELPEGTTDHEELINLMGGASTGHYHLTELEMAGVRKLITALIPSGGEVTLPEGKDNHEELEGLLGGADNGHYHLTSEEITGLGKLITTLIPTGEEVKLPNTGTSDHEELNTLYGGSDSGHYHLTELEMLRLRKVLKVLYPIGADNPIFPSGEADAGEVDLGDPFGGLPKGTPPAWMPNAVPTTLNGLNGYSSSSGIQLNSIPSKMYYGNTRNGNNLLVLLGHTSGNTVLLAETNNLSTWYKRWGMTISQYFNTITDYLNVGTILFLGSTICGTSAYNHSLYLYTGGTDVTSFGLSKLASAYRAFSSFCYSPQLNFILAVPPEGWAVKIEIVNGKPQLKNNYAFVCGISVNPGCAAWSPEALIFCVTGPEGTSISADGETWEVHTEAPHNLVDMSFRDDLHCFFARGGDDKLFYASNDGITWSRLNSTPIPLETVTAVDYNPDLQWYCAVGGTGKYAYFSKDLEHWIKTTITNGTAIEAGSVIWMPSTKKYVLMPTSGTYYYTFSPEEWEGAVEDTGDDTGN